jgi:hypothetical protein
MFIHDFHPISGCETHSPPKIDKPARHP